MPLPSDKQARKATPITTGVLDYFPDAIAEVARVSKVANDQHNPGEPMHWAREKSTDHADCISRHLLERGTIDDDGLRHTAKVAWRALALLQTELEDAEEEAKQQSFVATLDQLIDEGLSTKIDRRIREDLVSYRIPGGWGVEHEHLPNYDTIAKVPEPEAKLPVPNWSAPPLDPYDREEEDGQYIEVTDAARARLERPGPVQPEWF